MEESLGKTRKTKQTWVARHSKPCTKMKLQLRHQMEEAEASDCRRNKKALRRENR